MQDDIERIVQLLKSAGKGLASVGEVVELLATVAGELDLTGNRCLLFKAAGYKVLLEALQRNASVTKLLLTAQMRWGNDEDMFNNDTAAHLAATLGCNSTLTEIDLCNCRVGVSGARALANALRSNVTLRVLLLDNNQLDDDGVQALADAMAVNMSITRLGLLQNANVTASSDAARAAIKEACKVRVEVVSCCFWCCF